MSETNGVSFTYPVFSAGERPQTHLPLQIGRVDLTPMPGSAEFANDTMNKQQPPILWHSLPGHLPQNAVDALAQSPHIERLSITQRAPLTVRLARRIESLRVGWAWLWCPVTPRAMRHVLRMPSLRTLDVLRITNAGTLPTFADAASLEVLRANHGLSERDLMQVSTSRTLREIGAQHAQITHASLAALLAMPALESLDLECTAFDDAMARRISRSSRIRSLDLGASRLTGRGLAHLTEMRQLRSLDLWETRISAHDLELLRRLPQLEYVSIGKIHGAATLDPAVVVRLLLELPALKRVWLDGVKIDHKQRADLDSRLESLRVT